MATQISRRKGTSAEIAAFTGVMGELTVNETMLAVHVHDGLTLGGNRTLMLSERGVANGVASLGSDGKVPAVQIPEITNGVSVVVDRAALKALDTTKVTTAFLKEGGREGVLVWRSGDYSARIAADTQEGQYIKATAIPSSSGAWVRENNGIYNIRHFGAVGNGTSDDAVPTSKWIDLCILDQVAGWAPAGQYRCASAIAKTFAGIQHLSMRGAGSDQTIFLFDNGGGSPIDGFSLTAQAGNWWNDNSPGTGIQLSGFSIVTTNDNAGTGLLINSGSVEGRPQRKNSLVDIVFRGRSSFSHNWAYHVDLLDAGHTWFDDCRWIMGGPGAAYAKGVGVRIRSSSATTDPTAIHFKACQALYGQYWVKPEDNVEGIYITQCDHVGGSVAVYMDVGSESGLHIVGGHYSCTAFNFYLKGVYDFVVNGAVIYLNDDSPSGTMYGVYAQNCGQGTISNNVFVGNGVSIKVGIVIDNTPAFDRYGITIDGNQFSKLIHGINLGANSKYVTVGINGFGEISGYNVKNDGTNNTLALVPNKVGLYQDSIVKTVGSGASQTLSFSLPAGVFSAKPRFVDVSANGQPIVGNYFFDSASSTALNAEVEVRSLTGALPNGAVRFQIFASQ
nr:MAG TPA: Putative tail fiber [Caudoviricetes sp.]